MNYIDNRKIHQLRLLRGWDQKKLAENARIDPSVISRLERGLQADARLSVVYAIAQALGVTVQDIVKESNASSNPEISSSLKTALDGLLTLPEEHQQHMSKMILAYVESVKEETQ